MQECNDSRVSSRQEAGVQKVRFHALQLRKIEEAFPERVLTTSATEAELREYFGTRKVVQYIRDNTER